MAQPEAERASSAKRSRPRAESVNSEREVARLLSQIQHRLTRKKHGDWVPSTIADVQSIAAQLRRRSPTSEHRKDLVLVLDHFLSAVLVSADATDAVLSQLTAVLGDLESVHDDIDEYLRCVYFRAMPTISRLLWCLSLKTEWLLIARGCGRSSVVQICA